MSTYNWGELTHLRIVGWTTKYVCVYHPDHLFFLRRWTTWTKSWRKPSAFHRFSSMAGLRVVERWHPWHSSRRSKGKDGSPLVLPSPVHTKHPINETMVLCRESPHSIGTIKTGVFFVDGGWDYSQWNSIKMVRSCQIDRHRYMDRYWFDLMGGWIDR